MEIFELRYFLGVARHENLHRASEALRVSPGSLSKAIRRLEEELSTKLFHREGRNIRLTDQGRVLQRRASELVQLEESTKVELAGHAGSLRVVLAGPEVLLTKMGLPVVASLRQRHPKLFVELHGVSDELALQEVAKGEAHLALVTEEVPASRGLQAKSLGEAKFQTYVGKGHPLYARAKAGKTIPVEEVLEHSFVSPSHPLLGRVGLKQSLDGWRDDQFPRQVAYLTSSLKILEELLTSGQALAYLPGYFAEDLEAEILKISGCPYACTQKVKLVARNPKAVSWLNRLF
jgi:DNA-binding transcriptional LysR family regulator